MAITAEELQVILAAKDKMSGPLGQATQKVGGLQKALGAITAPAKAAMGALGKVGTVAAGMLSAQVIGRMTGALTGLFTGAIQAGGDAGEMISKFGVTFGGAAERMTKSLESFGAATGRSKYDLMGMAADFGAVLKGMGLNEAATADYSDSLAKLAVDVGSFTNKSATDVMERFRAGITGETESLKALGIVISAAAVDQQLLTMGVEGGAKAASQAQLVQARYALIMKATADAQGDAVRTSDSWANQMVALKGTWKDFQADLGRGLTDALKPALQIFTSLARVALPVVQEKLLGAAKAVGAFLTTAVSLKGTVGGAEEGFVGLAGGLQKLFGLSDKTTTAIDRVAESVGLFIFSVKEGTSPLHKLAAGVQSLAKPFEDVFISLKQREMGPAVGDLAAMLGLDEDAANKIGQAVDGIQGHLTDAFGALKKGDLKGVGEGLFAAFGDFGGLKGLLQSNLADAVSSAFDALGQAIPSLQPFIDTFIQPLLGIGDTILEAITGAQGAMGEALGGIFSELGNLDLGGLLDTLTATFSGVVTIVQNVLGDVLPVVMPILTDMVRFVTQQFGVIVGWVNQNLPLIQATIETVLGAIQTVWDNVWPQLAQVLQAVWEIVKTVVETGVQTVLGIIKAVMLVIQGDWQGAWDEIKAIGVRTWEAIKEIIQTGVDLAKGLVAGAKDGLIVAAYNWLKGLQDAVYEKIGDALKAIGEKIGEAPAILKGKANDLKQAGMDMIQGLIDGVKAKAQAVLDELGGLASDAISTAKKVLGIASPSTEFAAIAVQMMEGLSVGIDQGKAKVMKDITKALGEFIGAFGKLMEIGWESERRGPVNVTAMLDQWEAIVMEAMARLQRITEIIGYDKIHKLKLTAGRLTEIIAAVLVDFSQMTMAKTPDIAAYFEQWEAVFLAALALLVRINATHGAALLNVVGEIADKVIQVFQILGVNLAQATPMRTSTTWQADMLLYIDQVVYLAEQMALKLLGLDTVTIGGLSTARSLAERFGAIMQAMGQNLEGIAPMGGPDWMERIVAYVEQVQFYASEVYDWLVEIDDTTALELERVAKIAPNIQALLGMLGQELAGDEFTWSADWMDEARYYVQRLRFWAGLVYNWLKEITGDVAIAVGAAAAVAGNVKSLLELIGTELAGDKFKWYSRWMDDARYYVQRLRFWAGLVYNWLNEIDDDTATNVARAAGIGDNVSKLLGLLGLGFDIKAAPATFKVDLSGFAANLRLAYETLKIEVNRVLSDVGEEGLGILAGASEKLQSVLGILNLGKVIEEMQVQKKLEPGQRRTAWSNVLVKFVDDLKVASQYLKDNLPSVTAIWGDGLDEMITLTQQIESFMEALANAIKATQEISESKYDPQTVLARIGSLGEVITQAKIAQYGRKPAVEGPGLGSVDLGSLGGKAMARGYGGADPSVTIGQQIGAAIAGVLTEALEGTSMNLTIRLVAGERMGKLGTRLLIAKDNGVAMSQAVTG